MDAVLMALKRFTVQDYADKILNNPVTLERAWEINEYLLDKGRIEAGVIMTEDGDQYVWNRADMEYAVSEGLLTALPAPAPPPAATQ